MVHEDEMLMANVSLKNISIFLSINIQYNKINQ